MIDYHKNVEVLQVNLAEKTKKNVNCPVEHGTTLHFKSRENAVNFHEFSEELVVGEKRKCEELDEEAPAIKYQKKDDEEVLRGQLLNSFVTLDF